MTSICLSSACLPWKRAYHEIPKASSHELFGWKERFGYWSVRAACRLRRHPFMLVLTAFQCWPRINVQEGQQESVWQASSSEYKQDLTCLPSFQGLPLPRS